MTTITTDNFNQINNTTLMQEYIKALIQNIEQSQIPKDLNLIFDGGVFNCGFAAGVALYIKELNNKKPTLIGGFFIFFLFNISLSNSFFN